MMMAADSGPPPHALADATLATVRDALSAYVSAPAATSGLRQPLCTMAEEARAIGLPPERLLVVLKQLWFEVLDSRRVEQGPDQVRMLQGIVTMCIQEYYGN